MSKTPAEYFKIEEGKAGELRSMSQRVESCQKLRTTQAAEILDLCKRGAGILQALKVNPAEIPKLDNAPAPE